MTFERLKNIARSGVLMKKKIEVPDTTTHCLNCGTDFEGSYCPHCGQYWKVKRITLTSIFEIISANIYGFQSNLPRTVISLLYRPGYLANDYIKGKRKDYTNPFSLIIIITAIQLLISQYMLDVDYTQIAHNFIHGHIENDDPKIQEDWIKAIAEFIRFANENSGIITIVLLPLFTIPVWLTYRRQSIFGGQSMNYWESIVFMGYMTCIQLMISLLLDLFNCAINIQYKDQIALLLSLPFLLLMIWQVFMMNPWKYLKRLIILLLNSLWFFTLLIMASFIIFIIFAIIRYSD